MAQQLLDALATMAHTISAGVPGRGSDDTVIGDRQNAMSLRLARTVDSYLDF